MKRYTVKILVIAILLLSIGIGQMNAFASATSEFSEVNYDSVDEITYVTAETTVYWNPPTQFLNGNDDFNILRTLSAGEIVQRLGIGKNDAEGWSLVRVKIQTQSEHIYYGTNGEQRIEYEDSFYWATGWIKSDDLSYENPTGNAAVSEDHFLSSYNKNNYLDLSISGNRLTIHGKLVLDGLKGVAFNIMPGGGDQCSVKSGEEFSFNFILGHSGFAKVMLATNRTRDLGAAANAGIAMEEGSYGSIGNFIFVEKTDNGYRFAPSAILEHNSAYFQAYTNPNNYCDSGKVPASVKATSDQIVGGETNDYYKLFALYKWVVENIYYDTDAYYGAATTAYDSEGVLETKRSVCEGYVNLLKDLILAQNIPCMTSATFSLGTEHSEESFATNTDLSLVTEANHANVEAWVNGRWIVMDPTWDSLNTYAGGNYYPLEPNGYYYFDITPEAFAIDHKYITRADANLKMVNGVVVGADALPTFSATPTTSAILVNGENINFDAYNINGNNYFKLRDLAYVLNGTKKQFGVMWDEGAKAINLLSNSPYTPDGGEMSMGDGTSKTAQLNISPIYQDGSLVTLTAYNIGGNNYFKLRDLGKAFDFDVAWDGANNTIVVDTAKSYMDD